MNEQAGNFGPGGRSPHAAPRRERERDAFADDPGPGEESLPSPVRDEGPAFARFESMARTRVSAWRTVGIPALMFVLTLLSTLMAGALQRGVAPEIAFSHPALLLTGLPFSLTLLLILGRARDGPLRREPKVGGGRVAALFPAGSLFAGDVRRGHPHTRRHREPERPDGRGRGGAAGRSGRGGSGPPHRVDDIQTRPRRRLTRHRAGDAAFIRPASRGWCTALSPGARPSFSIRWPLRAGAGCW